MDGRWDQATRVSGLIVGFILAAGLMLALFQVSADPPEWVFVPIALALLIGSCVLLVCLVRAVTISHGWHRGGSLLVAVLVLPLILLTTTWLVLWWGTTFAGWGFGVHNARFPPPEPPAVVHAADCEDVPPRVIDEIVGSRMVGHIETVERERVSEIGGMEDNSYRIRLDAAEFDGWVALPTPDDLAVQGYFVAAHVDGAHSWAPLVRDDWQTLNTFSSSVVFFKSGELVSTGPITAHRDQATTYRTRLTKLFRVNLPIDRDSWATLAACLGFEELADSMAEVNLPWIWNRQGFNTVLQPPGRP